MGVAISLAIFGVVLCFLCFLYALKNFIVAVKNDDKTLYDLFKGHISAMIGMAFGAVMTVIGIILLAVELIKKI